MEDIISKALKATGPQQTEKANQLVKYITGNPQYQPNILRLLRFTSDLPFQELSMLLEKFLSHHVFTNYQQVFAQIKQSLEESKQCEQQLYECRDKLKQKQDNTIKTSNLVAQNLKLLGLQQAKIRVSMARDYLKSLSQLGELIEQFKQAETIAEQKYIQSQVKKFDNIPEELERQLEIIDEFDKYNEFLRKEFRTMLQSRSKFASYQNQFIVYLGLEEFHKQLTQCCVERIMIAFSNYQETSDHLLKILLTIVYALINISYYVKEQTEQTLSIKRQIMNMVSLSLDFLQNFVENTDEIDSKYFVLQILTLKKIQQHLFILYQEHIDSFDHKILQIQRIAAGKIYNQFDYIFPKATFEEWLQISDSAKHFTTTKFGEINYQLDPELYHDAFEDSSMPVDKQLLTYIYNDVAQPHFVFEVGSQISQLFQETLHQIINSMQSLSYFNEPANTQKLFATISFRLKKLLLPSEFRDGQSLVPDRASFQINCKIISTFAYFVDGVSRSSNFLFGSPLTSDPIREAARTLVDGAFDFQVIPASDFKQVSHQLKAILTQLTQVQNRIDPNIKQVVTEVMCVKLVRALLHIYSNNQQIKARNYDIFQAEIEYLQKFLQKMSGLELKILTVFPDLYVDTKNWKEFERIIGEPEYSEIGNKIAKQYLGNKSELKTLLK
ncbi:Conserved_hypothetical protein [Hexamita inflata]|uniref:Exocyst complex component Sec8 n=1 Tax=Hexamita inflata TaxID=28002 RepID=A0ABP1GF31_9EUKA